MITHELITLPRNGNLYYPLVDKWLLDRDLYLVKVRSRKNVYALIGPDTVLPFTHDLFVTRFLNIGGQVDKDVIEYRRAQQKIKKRKQRGSKLPTPTLVCIPEYRAKRIRTLVTAAIRYATRTKVQPIPFPFKHFRTYYRETPQLQFNRGLRLRKGKYKRIYV